MSDTPLTDAEGIRLRISIASHQAMVAFARVLERHANAMAEAIDRGDRDDALFALAAWRAFVKENS